MKNEEMRRFLMPGQGKPGCRLPEGFSKPSLEVLRGSTEGPAEVQPPSALTAACPIINIPPTELPPHRKWGAGLLEQLGQAVLWGPAMDEDERLEALDVASSVLEAVGVELVRVARDSKPLPRLPAAVELHVVASRNRPGQLSFRREPTDAGWSEVFEALEAAGFKPGDVVRVTKVAS